MSIFSSIVSSIVSFFVGEQKQTANIAKERLQFVLKHERGLSATAGPDYLPELQKELIAVISKYANIDPADVQVKLDRQDTMDVLEVKFELLDSR